MLFLLITYSPIGRVLALFLNKRRLSCVIEILLCFWIRLMKTYLRKSVGKNWIINKVHQIAINIADRLHIVHLCSKWWMYILKRNHLPFKHLLQMMLAASGQNTIRDTHLTWCLIRQRLKKCVYLLTHFVVFCCCWKRVPQL